jgi:hypothetical protein
LFKHIISLTEFEIVKEYDLPNVVIPPVLNKPVDEKTFMRNVRGAFKKFNVHVSTDLPQVLGKLCRTLNHSITNPKQSSLDLRNIWAFPAQTGTGKSIALQVYVALLKVEASLIVVSTRVEANKYSEYICNQSGDADYAMAIFSGGDSEKYQFSCDSPDKVKQYRCIIVTHKRMQDLADADKGTQELYGRYIYNKSETKPRELVVIDEKLSFANHESVTMAEYGRMLDFVDNALVYSKPCRALGKRSQVTKQLSTIKGFLISEAKALTDEKSAKLIEPHDMTESLNYRQLIETIDLQLFENVVNTRFDDISTELNLVTNSKGDRFKKEKSKTLTLVKKFRRIMQRKNGDGEYCDLKNLVLFKTNQAITVSKFKQFYSAFGACVVLDATATVNEFYNTASTGWLPTFDVIDVPKIRKYNNLKIFTATGYLQSRNALYGTEEKMSSNKDEYTPVINSLKAPASKLLVVGHKYFISTLECDYFGDKEVTFTHWGNHVGKNIWNDCSKVLVIGWNYLPPLETVAEIYGAYMPSGDIKATSKITKQNIEAFSTAQLAEDIVQAVMRTRARVIADDNSNCLPTEVYLLYPDRDKEQSVIDKVISEFPNASVQSWKPPFGITHSTLTKPQKNAHNILLTLDSSRAKGKTEISYKDVRDAVGFSSSTFSKALAESYFEEGLETRGITIKNINGRQKKFVF